ncbi:MAG: aminoglycoside 3'-phosphotransferase [Oscillospiraceae bacterium]|nr:aminoglycoside 3'-phosphotransferase [Oscillospiraceae bacterium]
MTDKADRQNPARAAAAPDRQQPAGDWPFLPPALRAALAHYLPATDALTPQPERTGRSGAAIWLYPELVLKIQPVTAESLGEVRMLQWLQGRLPVPELLAQVRQEGQLYILMSRAPGQMACAPLYLQDPPRLSRLLAGALRQLEAVPVQGCPGDCRLTRKLRQAAYNVRHGRVDLRNVEPETFGPAGFRDPEALLRWLQDHQPPEELCLTHGDCCLPNIMARPDAFQPGRDQVTAFLDLGRCGLADPWQDRALAYRSLRDNLSGRYRPQPEPGKAVAAVSSAAVFSAAVPSAPPGPSPAEVRPPAFKPEQLFTDLGLRPDWERIRYYLLLDELF